MKTKIPISEMFISPQGEGISTGLISLFIRVAGCNFAIESHPCKYCDTPYAWNKIESTLMTIEEIDNKVINFMTTNGLKEICLTGGEPLLYAMELFELIKIWSNRYHLTIETNGSYSIWQENCCWSLDVKCPDSGNMEHNIHSNLALIEKKDQVKFVISNADDFEFATTILMANNATLSLSNIFFIPAYNVLKYEELIGWVKNDKYLAGKVRIGTQCHKTWYPGINKGV